MREIIFRAWHPESKVMIEFNGNDFKDMYKAHHFGLLVNNEHHEGKDLLMQFTGLTDKNGVKIFEGDILKDGIFNVYGKVYWSEFSASFECDELVLARGGDFIVAGNIHQNDELLK